MPFLFGSAPQANFSTQSTIQPQQQGLLQVLAQLLGGTGSTPAGTIAPAQGTFAAPVTGQESSVLSALQPLVGTTNAPGLAAGGNAVNNALDVLPGALNYQAPQIDATKAFTQGVVQPVTQNFNEQVLPAIEGQFGGSAGGATGTGSLMARETAGNDLSRTLAQTGAQFKLGADTANQSASLSSQDAILRALGITSQLATTSATLPGTSASSNVSPLLQILQAFTLPQNTQQQQISGSYSNAQQTLADLIASFSPGTQQTLGVGTGGTQGILGPLLAAAGQVGGGYASGSAIGNALAAIAG